MVDSRREALQLIREDCETDATKWEGREMTGRNVATIHGETLAMIEALAHIVDSLLPDGEA